MKMEISSMFYSSNPYKRRDDKSVYESAFMSKTVPLVGYIKDIVVIILVIVFADGMLWFAITIIFLPSVIRELIQFVVGYNSYFLRWKNWCDLLLIALIVVVIYVPNEYVYDPLFFSLKQHIDKVCPLKNSQQESTYSEGKSNITIVNHLGVKRGLAGFIIILSWTRLLFQIAKHPGKHTEKWNKYILMYRTVAISFLKLLFIYSFFIISFALGFYIIFHNDIGEARLKLKDGEGTVSPYRFFDTPFESFAKTFAMFIGEVDFNNIPIGISYERRHGNISGSLAYFFFLCFIFMVVIVLMNLLNGLAVSDIGKIVDDAEIQHQISMIHILKELEDMAINNRLGLERFFRLKCLKPLLRMFDFEE